MADEKTRTIADLITLKQIGPGDEKGIQDYCQVARAARRMPGGGRVEPEASLRIISQLGKVFVGYETDTQRPIAIATITPVDKGIAYACKHPNAARASAFFKLKMQADGIYSTARTFGNGELLELHDICVEPSHQRRGFGLYTLRHAIYQPEHNGSTIQAMAGIGDCGKDIFNAASFALHLNRGHFVLADAVEATLGKRRVTYGVFIYNPETQVAVAHEASVHVTSFRKNPRLLTAQIKLYLQEGLVGTHYNTTSGTLYFNRLI